MADKPEPTIESMEKTLKAAQTARWVVATIFALIILAWIALGYWRTNVPVFVATIAMGLTSFVAASAGANAMASKIEAKKNDEAQSK